MLNVVMMKLTLMTIFFNKNQKIFSSALAVFTLFLFFLNPQNILSVSPETDFLSLSLVLLTSWLILFMTKANFTLKSNSLLMVLFKFMYSFLLITFYSSSFMIFYFFFESSLIPIFFIILIWGYQPERLMASMMMFFYTLFASFPLLIAIIILNTDIFSSSMENFHLSLMVNNMWMNISLVAAFLVKFPMFLVHLWLPKAHVEAPVSGSMLLAGILLKLGGYGIFRVSKFLFLGPINLTFMVLSMVGGAVLSLVSCSLMDMKLMIAYSSVVHMALIIYNLLSLNYYGISGVWWMMLAHGLVSSNMFAGANMIYERSHSRSIIVNKGNLTTAPVFSKLWFFIMMMNFAGPFTLNLFSEIVLIVSTMSTSLILALPIFFLSFFSAAYSLILYSSLHQGKMYFLSYMFTSLNFREINILVMQIFPVFLILLNLEIL